MLREFGFLSTGGVENLGLAAVVPENGIPEIHEPVYRNICCACELPIRRAFTVN